MLALRGSAWRSSLAQCSHRAGLPGGGGGEWGGVLWCQIERDDHVNICFNFLLTFTFSWVMLLAPWALNL